MKLHDYIKFKDSDTTGQVIKILPKNKLEIILDNGFIIQTEAPKVELAEPPKEEKPKPGKKLKVMMPPPKVDLHIQELINDYKQLSNAEKIQIQLDEFERQLDAAIGSGMLEITFIHGIGAGVLRNEIHRRLRSNKVVKSFGDAQWDRGATLVKLY